MDQVIGIIPVRHHDSCFPKKIYSTPLLQWTCENAQNSKVFDRLYAYIPEFLENYSQLPITSLQLAKNLQQLKILEHGYAIDVAVVEIGMFVLDTSKDLKAMEQLLVSKSKINKG